MSDFEGAANNVNGQLPKPPAPSRVPTSVGSGRSPASPGSPGEALGASGTLRRVGLSVARIDPRSVVKLAFLLSVAFGIMMVVAAAILWLLLDSMAVFDSSNTLLLDIGNSQLLGLMEYMRFDRVMAMATIIAVFNVVLLTALAAVGAYLYNLVASMVGGMHLTLMDE